MKFRFLDNPEIEHQISIKSIFTKDTYLPEICYTDACFRIAANTSEARESFKAFWYDAKDVKPDLLLATIGTENLIKIISGNLNFDQWLSQQSLNPELLFSIDGSEIKLEINKKLCKYLKISNPKNEEWIPVIGYRRR